jgi:hypothetical protein
MTQPHNTVRHARGQTVDEPSQEEEPGNTRPFAPQGRRGEKRLKLIKHSTSSEPLFGSQALVFSFA